MASEQFSCDPEGTFLTFAANWDCTETVRLHGTTNFLRDNLGGPVDSWNAAIGAAGFGTAPSFVTTLQQGQATANVQGVTSGSEFCGTWNPVSKVLEVNNETHSPCANAPNRGSIGDMLIHEMAHVWGWEGGSNIGHNGGVAGVSDHCALALPSSGLNTTICAHNIEGGLAGYGLRSLSSSNFWSTPFVTGHNGPGSYAAVSVQEGDTHSLTLGSLQKERGGSLSGGWQLLSSNTSVATVSSSGLITAVDSGTTTITVKPTTGSGYFLTSAFAASSRTVQVTVTPQPPAALVVQNITINTSLPITLSNSYQWTAVLGSGDPSGITFRWVFEYSYSSPPDSVFIPTRQSGDPGSPWIKPPYPATIYVGAGQAVSMPVDSGSYTIRVKVWPIRNGVAGSPAARDYPVCTSSEGGGGNDLRATPGLQMAPEPPPETDAVEGCA